MPSLAKPRSAFGLAALIVILAVAAFAVWGGAPGDEPAGPAVADGAAAQRSPPDADRVSDAPGRRAVAAAAPADAGTGDDTPAPHRARWTVRGRVLDVVGKPLPGVPVRQIGIGSADTLGTSDPAGRFEVAVTPTHDRVELVARGAGFAAIRKSVVQAHNVEREHLLIAAPAVDLAGTVVDERRAEIEGSTVRVVLGLDVTRRFPHPLDMTAEIGFRDTTDARGRFELGAVPSLRGALLSAELEGHARYAEPLPPRSRDDLVLVLTTARAGDEPSITGFVLLPDRRPARGARVRFGFQSTRTAENGAFRMSLVRGEPDLPLVAGLEDHGSAVTPRFGAVVEAAWPRAPEPVTLILREAPLEIRGRVVDVRGAPLQNWVVSITDGTHVTRRQFPPALVEGYGKGRAQHMTAADGRFRLVDLLDREYSVRAYDRSRLTAVSAGPIRAGAEDVAIVVPDGLTRPRVRGRVLSPHGDPVAGATVTLGMVTHSDESGSAWVSGASTTTDERGSFELESVPKQHVHFDVGGEVVVPKRFEPEPGDPFENLTFAVARRCHFRATVVGADTAELRVELRDAAGDKLSIYRFRSGGWSSNTVAQLTDGRTGVCAASENARELVVLRERDVVGRQEVALDPSGVTELVVELR